MAQSDQILNLYFDTQFLTSLVDGKYTVLEGGNNYVTFSAEGIKKVIKVIHSGNKTQIGPILALNAGVAGVAGVTAVSPDNFRPDTQFFSVNNITKVTNQLTTLLDNKQKYTNRIGRGYKVDAVDEGSRTTDMKLLILFKVLTDKNILTDKQGLSYEDI